MVEWRFKEIKVDIGRGVQEMRPEEKYKNEPRGPWGLPKLAPGAPGPTGCAPEPPHGPHGGPWGPNEAPMGPRHPGAQFVGNSGFCRYPGVPRVPSSRGVPGVPRGPPWTNFISICIIVFDCCREFSLSFVYIDYCREFFFYYFTSSIS